jgi:hypothetical protein
MRRKIKFVLQQLTLPDFAAMNARAACSKDFSQRQGGKNINHSLPLRALQMECIISEYLLMPCTFPTTAQTISSRF